MTSLVEQLQKRPKRIQGQIHPFGSYWVHKTERGEAELMDSHEVAEWIENLVEVVDAIQKQIQKRRDFYYKMANKPVQVKRQYFQGITAAFNEILELLEGNKK